MGRLTSLEAKRRTAHFLELVAEGERYDVAAAKSRIDPRRALRLVGSPSFGKVIDEVRKRLHDSIAA